MKVKDALVIVGGTMRFIFNFIFFGLLFYLIWLYFPEPFHTMQGWAASIVDFVKDLAQQLFAKMQSGSTAHPVVPS